MLDPLDELLMWADVSQKCLNAVAEGYDSMTVHFAVIGHLDAAVEMRAMMDLEKARRASNEHLNQHLHGVSVEIETLNLTTFRWRGYQNGELCKQSLISTLDQAITEVRTWIESLSKTSPSQTGSVKITGTSTCSPIPSRNTGSFNQSSSPGSTETSS